MCFENADSLRLEVQNNIIDRNLKTYGCFQKNRGTSKSSILIEFSIINHPFWVSLFLETPI